MLEISVYKDYKNKVWRIRRSDLMKSTYKSKSLKDACKEALNLAIDNNARLSIGSNPDIYAGKTDFFQIDMEGNNKHNVEIEQEVVEDDKDQLKLDLEE